MLHIEVVILIYVAGYIENGCEDDAALVVLVGRSRSRDGTTGGNEILEEFGLLGGG